MAKYLMGIDNGGTMTKAAIFDTAGNEIATGSQDTPLLVPQDGFCERDMNDLWNATVNACLLYTSFPEAKDYPAIFSFRRCPIYSTLCIIVWIYCNKIH